MPTEYADLFQTDKCVVLTAEHKPIRSDLSFFWATPDPAVLVITVTAQDGDFRTWEVARNLLINADEEWARGSWIGGGAFAVCYRGPNVLFTFRNLHESRQACVVANVGPVREFIAHTRRILDAGEPEQAVYDVQVDTALERILRDA